jgi:hypothetical protein
MIIKHNKITKTKKTYMQKSCPNKSLIKKNYQNYQKNDIQV